MDKNFNKWIKILSENFISKISEIVKVWENIGVDGEKMEARMNSLSKHINELLNNMLEEENQHRQDLKLNIQQVNDEISLLCKILKVERNIPLKESLIKNEQESLKIKKELCIIKESRIARYYELIDLEKELCERLFEIRQEFDMDLVPSEEELYELNKNIQKLQLQKSIRKESFLKKRIEVVKYFQLLKKTVPKDGFIESILIDELAEDVPLSEDFLNQCDLLIKQMNEEYERNKHECIKLRSRYSILCGILYPDIKEANHCIYTFKDSTDFSCQTVEKLRYDVNLLEKHRHDKMEEFIINYQKQIEGKLNSNLLSHFKIKEPYHSLLSSKNFEEEILNKLELKLDELIEVEKEVLPIQKEVENWNNCFSKLIHLKLQLKDPNVLKNRGGILLKVEKEKKIVLKELPKSEAKIESLLLSLKSELIVADDLLIDGQKILDYLLYQWNNIDGEKENDKKNSYKNDLVKVLVSKSSVTQKKLPLSKINESQQSIKVQNTILLDSSVNIQKKLPLSKINEIPKCFNVLNKVAFNTPADIQNKLTKPKPNVYSYNDQEYASKKTSFKIPQLKKMNKKVLPISPIHKAAQQFPSLNKRLSRSCSNLNRQKLVKSKITISNNNLYGMFCENIEPGIGTSSFLEHISNII